jgi:ABC-type phosphate/phosphonate transport system substrate-binding protein
MSQRNLKLISIATTVALLAACSEQDSAAAPESTKAVSDAAPVTEAPSTQADIVEAATPEADGNLEMVMDLPVNFSTPEDIEKSIERVRQGAGDKKAKQLSIAMKYILAYDLSLGNSEEKMYKKLNGSTPNEIIARMK